MAFSHQGVWWPSRKGDHMKFVERKNEGVTNITNTEIFKGQKRLHGYYRRSGYPLFVHTFFIVWVNGLPKAQRWMDCSPVHDTTGRWFNTYELGPPGKKVCHLEGVLEGVVGTLALCLLSWLPGCRKVSSFLCCVSLSWQAAPSEAMRRADHGETLSNCNSKEASIF